MTVEAPADADVVTFQVGSTVRRTDRQQDMGAAAGHGRHGPWTAPPPWPCPTTPSRRVGAEAAQHRGHKPPTNIPLPHEACPTDSRSTPEKKTLPVLRSDRAEAFDANYEGEGRRQRADGAEFVQNVGYDADGKLVGTDQVRLLAWTPGRRGDRPRLAVGVPGDPDEPITMTRYYAAKRTLLGRPGVRTIVKSEEHANHYYARDPVRPETTMADYGHVHRGHRRIAQVASARDERDRIALWSHPAHHLHRRRSDRSGGGRPARLLRRAPRSRPRDRESDSDGGRFFAGRRDADTGPMPPRRPNRKLPTQRPDPPDQGFQLTRRQLAVPGARSAGTDRRRPWPRLLSALARRRLHAARTCPTPLGTRRVGSPQVPGTSPSRWPPTCSTAVWWSGAAAVRAHHLPVGGAARLKPARWFPTPVCRANSSPRRWRSGIRTWRTPAAGALEPARRMGACPGSP